MAAEAAEAARDAQFAAEMAAAEMAMPWGACAASNLADRLAFEKRIAFKEREFAAQHAMQEVQAARNARAEAQEYLDILLSKAQAAGLL